MRFVCVKWGDKYSDDYVKKLVDSVRRHMPAFFDEMVCFTDAPVSGIDCEPLLCEHPTWWQKVGLFKPGALPGENFYLDLDVVVTSSFHELVWQFATAPNKLWALDDFSYSLRQPKHGLSPETIKMLGGFPGTINSSVMAWRASSITNGIWTQFGEDVFDEQHGDQNWITRVLWPHCISLFRSDGLVGSYKYQSNTMPLAISVFHGDPKPSDVEDEWVKRNWTY